MIFRILIDQCLFIISHNAIQSWLVTSFPERTGSLSKNHDAKRYVASIINVAVMIQLFLKSRLNLSMGSNWKSKWAAESVIVFKFWVHNRYTPNTVRTPKRSLFVGNLGDMKGVDGRKVGRNGWLKLVKELKRYGLEDKQKKKRSLSDMFYCYSNKDWYLIRIISSLSHLRPLWRINVG